MESSAIALPLKRKAIPWKTLYAGRRGAATILTELTGDALAAKELLRNSNCQSGFKPQSNPQAKISSVLLHNGQRTDMGIRSL
jgi:hypothetical protein